MTPARCSTCDGLGHPHGGPECPECGHSGAQGAPATCEACGDAIPEPRHGSAIGGGWADLCDACAARLCACGAFVLQRPESFYHDGDDVHAREVCTNGATRVRGCSCHRCRLASGVAS